MTREETGTLRLTFEVATPEDAPAIAALRNAAADALTAQFGAGHWSGLATERGVMASMRHAKVCVARHRGEILGTLRLAAKKPWAIDASYFTACTRPVYLTDMAVLPAMQRSGVGRRCMLEAIRVAREWPADAIRLDAYDAAAGAGPFYEKCGLQETGRVAYRGTPLIYYERLL